MDIEDGELSRPRAGRLGGALGGIRAAAGEASLAIAGSRTARSLLVVGSLWLASCAGVDQLQFDREARALARDGMPIVQAVSNLQRAGFVCSPDGSNPPSFDCVRIRDRLVASCVERVTFVDTSRGDGAIAELNVAAIACAR